MEIFWIIAMIASLYFGLWAFEIHPGSRPNKKDDSFNKHYRFTQYFTNFIGALIGWIALYYLLKLDWSNANIFELEHLVLLYIAFVGITGNLPFVSKFFKY